MVSNVEPILKEFSTVKTKRAPWETVWELIARYMYQRKIGFTMVDPVGNFYAHDDVYGNIPGQALQSMVSSLDGALWKNGARTFRVSPPVGVAQSEEIKKFYQKVNQRLVFHVEHEKAAFGTARLEAFSEGAAFGTDGLGVFAVDDPNSEHKIEYKAMSLKNLYVVEDSNGRVVKEFYEFEYNAFQLVAEYGESARTEKVKATIEKPDYETKFTVLFVVRPRTAEAATVKSYESVHILVDDKKVLRESGYSGNPIIVSRFYKNEGEEYGRSPGFNALNAAIEASALVEMITKGVELGLWPPWFVLDDGTFGNGIIDRSAGSVIPIDLTSSKILGSAPIGQIGSVGDLNAAVKLLEMKIAEINGHFFVDRFTDLNNKTRMTFGEAQIRNELRADSTGSIFSRQIEEKLTPVIRRSITILEEAGELGVEHGSELEIQLRVTGKELLLIPDALLRLRQQGVEIYQISYISPAARILRAEELRGIISSWQFAAAFAETVPELLLRLDKKRTMELVNELGGAPDEILLSDELYEAELEALKKSQQMAMQIRMMLAEAEIKTKEASAHQQDAQAEATLGGLNGLLNGGGAGNPAGLG